MASAGILLAVSDAALLGVGIAGAVLVLVGVVWLLVRRKKRPPAA